MNGREIRGFSILAKGIEPKALDEETFLVPSQSSRKKYHVRHRDEWSCTCSDFHYRGVECKHILAVKYWIKLREKVDSEDTLDIVSELEKPRCPKCNSEELIKKGIRKNKNGEKQRYKCKKCGKKFVNDPFKKFKVDGKIIVLTMDLYYKGLSLRDIVDTLYQFYGIKLHHETVRRWIMRFIRIMNEYVNKLHPKVGKQWHVDEQNVKIKGKWFWCWNMIDHKTRFLIADFITEHRYIDDARIVFRRAKRVTQDKPEFIVTDGLWSYEKAIRKEFVTHKRRKNRVKHIRLETFESKKNNNIIERYHGTFRERDKVMRGFKAERTARELTEGFRTYYNFIKPHHALDGRTPQQEADINLELGRNRWMNLMKKSLEEVPKCDTKIRSPEVRH